MPSIKGGVEEAAKMLSGLDRAAQERVLETIAKQNPEMAEALRQSMVTFEDLKYLTVRMLQDLLKEIKIEDLGLALRVGSNELREHILSNVSKTMREDIQSILNGPPQPVNKVQEVAEKIMEIVRDKVEKGELILDKAGTEEFV